MTKLNVQNNGPNQVLFASRYHTTNPAEVVKLLMAPNEKFAPLSVPGLLTKTAKAYPNITAFCTKNSEGGWKKTSYKEYEEAVIICAKAFFKLGLKRHHAVCILGYNSPEWHISNIAAIYAGGFATGIYTTNSAEQCLYCLRETNANIIVVESDQLGKILEIREKLKDLKAIVEYGGSSPKFVISWNFLMKIGKNETNNHLNEILETLAINECAAVVFTPGSSGHQKAVLLSHDNLTWEARTLAERFRLNQSSEKIVSYLPLGHITNQMLDIYVAMTVAATVYFSNKDAFKGTLISFLMEVKPTIFLSVPKVWEKMQKIAINHKSLQSKFAKSAKFHAGKYFVNKIEGRNTYSIKHRITKLVFRSIRAAFGFDRCALYLSHSAPLSSEVKNYFMSIDIPIMETYGTTENSGIHTTCTLDAFGLETMGSTLYGAKTAIISSDVNGLGEVWIYGRHLCMGYLNNSLKNDACFNEESWFNTGNIGYISGRGLVFITGVLKEYIILKTGEWVSPIEIEENIVNELPYISNCMVVGQGKQFISVILTLRADYDMETGMPLDTLTMESKQWLEELNCPAETVSEVIEAGPNPDLVKFIARQISKANLKTSTNARRVEKFVILPRDFSIATGEFGPTMKLNRKLIYQKNKKLIDELYVGE